MEQIINELLQQDGHQDTKPFRKRVKEVFAVIKEFAEDFNLSVLVRLFMTGEKIDFHNLHMVVNLLKGSVNFQFQLEIVTEMFKDHPVLLNLLLDAIAENEQRKIDAIDEKIAELSNEDVHGLEQLNLEKSYPLQVLSIIDHWGDRPNKPKPTK